MSVRPHYPRQTGAQMLLGAVENHDRFAGAQKALHAGIRPELTGRGPIAVKNKQRVSPGILGSGTRHRLKARLDGLENRAVSSAHYQRLLRGGRGRRRTRTAAASGAAQCQTSNDQTWQPTLKPVDGKRTSAHEDFSFTRRSKLPPHWRCGAHLRRLEGDLSGFSLT